jgi:hypothetical protein
MVTFMFGKTTMSSSGTSSNVLNFHHLSVVATYTIVASIDEVPRSSSLARAPGDGVETGTTTGGLAYVLDTVRVPA